MIREPESMDEDVVRRVYHTLPGQPSRYGKAVHWAAINKQGTIGGVACSAEELVAYAAQAENEGRNFYVQPNPGNAFSETRCKTEDITAWSWFLVDIDRDRDLDPLTFEEADELANHACLILMSYLGVRFGLQRVIVHSGRGVQLWLRVSDNHPSLQDGCATFSVREPADWHEGGDIGTAVTREGAVLRLHQAIPIAQAYWLRKLAARWEQECPDTGTSIDTTSNDLPRLMRCPGTVNMKSGLCATFIENTVEKQDGGVFRLPSHLVLDYVPARDMLRAMPTITPDAKPLQNWTEAVPRLSKRAREYLLDGVREPGRHQAAVAAARALAEAGCSEGAILGGLLKGGSKCTPALEDWEYLSRTATEAYQSRSPFHRPKQGING